MIKTPEGKVLLFDAAGQQYERWPVDAKHMVATGEFSYSAPSGVTPVVPPAPPATVLAGAKLPDHPLGIPQNPTNAADAPPGEPLT